MNLSKSITLLVMAVMTVISTTGFAAVRCQSHNAAGVVWHRTRATRYEAIVSARGVCERNSINPANCVVPSDSCVEILPPRPIACVARDKRGRTWQAFSNASKRNACHRAVRKCRRWHGKRGMDNWACWV